MTNTDREAANERLNLLISLRRYSDAEEFAREAIGREPEWAAGYTHLARALNALGRHQEAADAARVGVTKAPTDPWAQAIHGYVLGYGDRPLEGLDAVAAAHRADPNYVWAHSVRAELLGRLGRWDESLVSARDGLALTPTDEELLFRKGWAELQLGQLDEAAITAETALRLHPSAARIVNLEGLTELHQAVRWDTHPRRWFQHMRAASRWFAAALRLEPNTPAYRENLRQAACSLRFQLTWVVLSIWYVLSVAAVFVVGFLGGLIPCGCCGASVLVWAWWATVSAVTRSEPMILTAPIGWLGLEAPPLEPSERRVGRRIWRFVLVSGILPSVAVAVVGLAIRR